MEERRAGLVRKANFKSAQRDIVIGQLGTASDEMRGFASNPMFLSLLCDYLREGHPFPHNAHNVFENYVENRLTRDQERLQSRYGLSPQTLRHTAQVVSFCMAADPGLGLSPIRPTISEALKRLSFPVPRDLDKRLDALEYLKLARSETTNTAGDPRPFTFAHRRFQEYFATCVVLQHPDRATPHQLLTNANWRETAVVLCQTQSADQLQPLIAQARQHLAEMTSNLPIPLVADSVGSLEHEVRAQTGAHARPQPSPSPVPFPWPPGALHLLGLLQDGFSHRPKDLPDNIRLQAAHLLATATVIGFGLDQKWALEVSGIVSEPAMVLLLRGAFAGKSQWIRDIAYRQVARLGQIPPDIARSIHRALRDMLLQRRLYRERYTIEAHLLRLDRSHEFVMTLRRLLLFPWFSLAWHALLFVVGIISLAQAPSAPLADLLSWLVFVAILYAPLAVLYLIPHWLSGESVFTNFLKIKIYFALLFPAYPILVKLSIPIAIPIALTRLQELLAVGYIYAILLYTTLWDVTFLSVDASNYLTKPVWWPFAPLASVLTWLRDMLTRLRDLRFPRITGIVLNTLIAGVITATVSIGLVSLVNILLMPYLSSLSTMCIPLLILLAIPINGVRAIRWMREMWRWHQWKQHLPTILHEQELLDLLKTFDSSHCVQLIRLVRNQNLLSPDDETRKLLEQMAIELELRNKQKAIRAKNSLPSSKAGTQHLLSERELGPEFLDELYSLIEQMRTRSRQGAQYQ